MSLPCDGLFAKIDNTFSQESLDGTSHFGHVDPKFDRETTKDVFAFFRLHVIITRPSHRIYEFGPSAAILPLSRLAFGHGDVRSRLASPAKRHSRQGREGLTPAAIDKLPRPDVNRVDESGQRGRMPIV